MSADPTTRQIEGRLDELFDRMLRMSDAELRMIRLAWEEGSTVDRKMAWTKARRVVESTGRQQLIEEARSTLSRWVNSYLSATTVEYGTFLTSPGSGMATADVRRDALPPLLDAVAAIVAADRLDPADAAALLEPVERLASVAEPPS